MDFAVLEALKEAAEAIDCSRTAQPERAAETANDTAARRREFASLMRSIRSMVREGT